MTVRRTGLLLPVALLAGCVPGPRPIPSSARIAPPLSWRDAASGDGSIDPHWWRAYGDPLLDQVVEKALARNTDVLSAIASVDQARAQLRLARSGLFPALSGIGDAQASHMGGGASSGSGASSTGGGSGGSGASGGGGAGGTTSTSGNGGTGSAGTTSGGTSNMQTFELGGLATWEIDLFGRVRAMTEAARRQYVASQADRDATALSVATQTVQAYIQLLATDEQIRLIQETEASRLKSVRIEQDRVKFGYDSRQEYLQALGDYQSVASQLPAELRTQRQQENALAMLTGDLPEPIERIASLRKLTVPSVPDTLPSALVRRRPDVASAEFDLAAADSTIAAQRAAFLPTITLTGDYLKVFSSAVGFNPVTMWSVGNSTITPLITAPLFQGGALRANFDTAVAQRDKAAFAYKAAVIKAFTDAENGLTGVARLKEQVQAVFEQVRTAHDSLSVQQDRNREGYTDFLNVLDAQRTLFTAQQSLISTESDRLTNLASLASALGGGWTTSVLDRSPSSPSGPVFQERPTAVSSRVQEKDPTP